jgi:hypothetical protein
MHSPIRLHRVLLKHLSKGQIFILLLLLLLLLLLTISTNLKNLLYSEQTVLRIWVYISIVTLIFIMSIFFLRTQ